MQGDRLKACEMTVSVWSRVSFRRRSLRLASRGPHKNRQALCNQSFRFAVNRLRFDGLRDLSADNIRKIIILPENLEAGTGIEPVFTDLQSAA